MKIAPYLMVVGFFAAGNLSVSAAPSLEKTQQKIVGDLHTWMKHMEFFLASMKPGELTPREQKALPLLHRILDTAKTWEVDRDMTEAKTQLTKRDYQQAVPPEDLAIKKLMALLYQEKSKENSLTSPNSEKPPATDKEGEKELTWKKTDPSAQTKTENSPPITSNEPSPSPELPSANPSTSNDPATALYAPRGETVKIQAVPNSSSDWAKLPPRQLERLVETRLDTLPAEYGWREDVKQYFMKIGKKSKKK